MTDRIADVLVIGGGPAGLAAALWLGRHQLRTVVADNGAPRNRAVDTAYGYLGFDCAAPDDLLQAGRRELQRYPTVTLEPVRITGVTRTESRFRAEMSNDERIEVNALIIATGVVDEIPAVPDLDRHYGKSVFVCPICDGHELRDKTVVVLGASGPAGAFASEVLQWASQVTVVPLGDEAPADALPAGVVLSGSPAASIGGDAVLDCVRLADGSSVLADAVFVRADVAPRTQFAADLGCLLEADARIAVDEDGRTSVDGVFAAGDCTPGPQIVQVAAAKGVRAGLACAAYLLAKGNSGADTSAQRPIVRD